MAVFYPARLEHTDAGYIADAVDIPGCRFAAESAEEAVSLSRDAAALALETMPEDRRPTPTPLGAVLGNGGMAVLLEIAPPPPARDERAIKKTLTLPAWLNALAEEEHINFSGVLKSALLEKLGLADEAAHKQKGAHKMEINLYMIQKPGEGNSKHFWSLEPIKLGGAKEEPASRAFVLPDGFVIKDDGFGGKAAFRGEDSYMLCTRGNLPVLAGCGEEIPLHPAAAPKR